jgi:hypothetical protein
MIVFTVVAKAMMSAGRWMEIDSLIQVSFTRFNSKAMMINKEPVARQELENLASINYIQINSEISFIFIFHRTSLFRSEHRAFPRTGLVHFTSILTLLCFTFTNTRICAPSEDCPAKVPLNGPLD